MKKLFLLSIAISSYGLALSQNGNVGIGTTTPNADAKLDITATNKGLLLPRVALTGTANAAPLSAHVAGMTVYNTKDTLDVTKGSYYNNGIKWIKIGDAATAWSLTGNAGTTPGTNYLGTKDSTAMVFKTNAINDTNSKMVIMPDGKVGIGTSNPFGPLHLAYNGGNLIGLADDYVIQRTTSNGDWSPISFLHARGSIASPQPLQKGDALGLILDHGYLSNGSWINQLNYLLTIYEGNGSNALSSLRIGTSGVTQMVIDTIGRVGIGTTTPTDKLSVNGHVSVGISPVVATSAPYPKKGNTLFFEGTENTYGSVAASNSDVLAMYRYEPASDQTELRIVIADNNPTYGDQDALVIGANTVGTTESIKYATPENFSALYRFSNNGTASKIGTAVWSVLSDIRSKENIKPYSGGLKELLQINPVNFNYKKEFHVGNKTYTGVIAQELEKVAPTMVTTSGERSGIKDFKEVDPNEFTYMLINAVKELKAENEALKKRVQALEKK